MIKLSYKVLTKHIVEAIEIEHLRPEVTPAAREALVAEKEEKQLMELIVFQVLLDCYNILDTITSQRLPLLLLRALDLLKAQEAPMNMP